MKRILILTAAAFTLLAALHIYSNLMHNTSSFFSFSGSVELSAQTPEKGTEAVSQDTSAAERGKYIFQATGGCGCHTDAQNGGAYLAGGREIKTPFGIMYGTNITPDPETGIGSWSDEDFLRAFREGKSPAGYSYYPVFPYTSFSGMTDQDLLDLKAYLLTLEPVKQQNKEQDLYFPFNFRLAAWAWQVLFYSPEVYQPDSGKSAKWNRGKYLTDYVGHCAECHTPRNIFGALDKSKLYAGSRQGHDGEIGSNLTPDTEFGIGSYSETDFQYTMRWGLKADGEDILGIMGELVHDGYSNLTDEDLSAMYEYLRSLKPIAEKP